jgi:hypothetical protein
MIVGRLLREVVVLSFPAAWFMRISQEIPPRHVMLPEDAGNTASRSMVTYGKRTLWRLPDAFEKEWLKA